MATLTINRQAQRAFSLKEWTNEKRTSVHLWLNTKSEFYSRLCDFSVTRRTVLYMHLGTMCLGVSVFAVVSHPLVAVPAAACAGWLVYGLNDKEKGEK